MRYKSILYSLLILCIGCAPYVAEKDHVDGQNIRINEELVRSDSAIDAMIGPYKAKLDVEMNEVVGVTEVDLIKATPESTMGNWFADLIMNEAKLLDHRVSFAIQNRGGLRIGSIKQGEITKGKIFELMPFDNFLVIMETDGTTMRSFIEHTAQNGGWPMSKEVKVTMQDTVVNSILINGDEINPSEIYFYAIPDYVANGGSDSSMLSGEKHENTGIMIRDLAINYLRKEYKKGNSINASLDQRFTRKKSK
tara:strand:- start:174 stop:926 length:753 start_codon:yes stop_codon:yes gene_type:complete